MVKYDIEHPDGKKYTLESPKPLTKEQLAKAVQEHAQVVTQEQKGDFTERTIYAKVGSPTPAKRQPQLATDFGEEEPRSSQFIRNARQDIADTPDQDFLDYTQEVLADRRKDRGKMKLGPLKLASDALDVVRQMALSPVTIPTTVGATLGREARKAKEKTGNPWGGVLPAAAELGSAMLPFGAEAFQALDGVEGVQDLPAAFEKFKKGVGTSVNESPVGALADVLPLAGAALKGAKLATAPIHALDSRIGRAMPSGVSAGVPRLSYSVRETPSLNYSPPRSRRVVDRLSGENMPYKVAAHADDTTPSAASKEHQRGQAPPKEVHELDRVVYDETTKLLAQIYDKTGRSSEELTDALNAGRIKFREWEDEFRQAGPGWLDSMVAAVEARKDTPADDLVSLFQANIALGRRRDQMYSAYDAAEKIAESGKKYSKEWHEQIAIAEKYADDIERIELKVRRPFVSQAGRVLAYQRFYEVRDAWDYSKVLEQLSDKINLGSKVFRDVSPETKRSLARYTHEIKKRQTALMQETAAKAAESDPLVRQWIDENKELLSQIKKHESEIDQLSAKRRQIVDAMSAKVKSGTGLPPGVTMTTAALMAFAETIATAPLGMLLGVSSGAGGLPGPGKAKLSKAKKDAAAVKRAAEEVKKLDAAIDSADGKRNKLADQLKARMSTAVKQFLELPAEEFAKAPIADIKRQSSKEMTRSEIADRKERNLAAKKEGQEAKRRGRVLAREAAAEKKIADTLDSLGKDRVKSPAVTPLISKETQQRLRDVTSLNTRVEGIKKNLSGYLDEDLLDDLFQSVADDYRTNGIDSARKMLDDATADARAQLQKERAAVRVAKKRANTADARLEKIGESSGRTGSKPTDDGLRVSKLNVVAGAMKRAYPKQSDEINASIERAKEIYRNDRSEDGFNQAIAELRSVRESARKAKANQAIIDKTTAQLADLGKKKEKGPPRNYLADTALVEFAKDVRSLDALAQKYKEKYGDVLPNTFFAQVYGEAASKMDPLNQRYDINAVKGALAEAMEQEVKKHRGAALKAWDVVAETNNFFRSVMASADVSYLGRQAGLAAMGRPGLALRLKKTVGADGKISHSFEGGLPEGLRVWKAALRPGGIAHAREFVHKSEGSILANAAERYGDAQFHSKVGLDFNVPPPDLKSGWFSLLAGKGDMQFFGQEELSSGWARKRAGVRQLVTASDLSFAAGRNKMAADLFDAMYDPKRMDVGVKEIADRGDAKSIAHMVNILTGRGELFGSGKLASLVLFSPKFTASRLEYAGKNALLLGGINKYYDAYNTGNVNSLAAKSIRQEHRRINRNLALTYGAARLSGMEIGTDSTSATFGMLKLPSGAWLDPLAGEKQLLVPFMRGFIGRSTNLAGKARDTEGWEQTGRALRGKLPPILSNAFSMSPALDPGRWKDFNGTKLAPDDRVQALAAMLGMNGIVPGSGAEKALQAMVGVGRLGVKSSVPLPLTQILEDVQFYSQKEGLSPEEAVFVLGHMLFNSVGVSVLNYDANRAPNPARKRGPGKGLSLPNPLSSIERKMALPKL